MYSTLRHLHLHLFNFCFSHISPHTLITLESHHSPGSLLFGFITFISVWHSWSFQEASSTGRFPSNSIIPIQHHQAFPITTTISESISINENGQPWYHAVDQEIIDHHHVVMTDSITTNFIDLAVDNSQSNTSNGMKQREIINLRLMEPRYSIANKIKREQLESVKARESFKVSK